MLPSALLKNSLRGLCITHGLLIMASAMAIDGTITITGQISDATCTINSGTPDLLVKLPKISATSALKNQNDIAGTTPFLIKLTACPASLSGQVGLYFEPGRTTDYTTQNLIAYTASSDTTTTSSSIPASPGTPANNVQIRLSNPDGTLIRMGTNVTEQNTSKVTLESNAAELRYLASYIKTGTMAISAGRIISYVQYSVIYP